MYFSKKKIGIISTEDKSSERGNNVLQIAKYIIILFLIGMAIYVFSIFIWVFFGMVKKKKIRIFMNLKIKLKGLQNGCERSAHQKNQSLFIKKQHTWRQRNTKTKCAWKVFWFYFSFKIIKIFKRFAFEEAMFT